MAEKKSDLSRAFAEDGAHKTHVGGQALLEGIMMRGKYNWSVAVREPEGGIYTEEHDLASGKPKNSWMNKPLVRGCRALVESLMIGFKALEIAGEHAFPDEEDEGEDDDRTRDRLEGAASGDVVGKTIAKSADGSNARGVAGCAVAGDEASGNALLIGKAEGAGDLAAAEETVNDAVSASVVDRPFSWKDDFGRPDEMIDALGAQRSLEVVEDPLPAAAGGGMSSTTDVAIAHSEEAGATEPAQASGPENDEAPSNRAAGEEKEGGISAMAVSMVIGVVLGVVLFIVAPAAVTNLIVGEYDGNPILWNVIDGILRVAVFIFYIWLIGRMSDIKRMFGYHGAEHKTIHCYEHGLPLTPENARSFPRLHVRCGTAFLIMVMIIAILVYTIVPVNLLIDALGVPDGLPKLALVIVVRIVFMPLIAGISYEITVKWAGSHPEKPLVKVILWPGMQMQYLTTREPDDGQIECAIAAMKLVLDREEAESVKAQMA